MREIADAINRRDMSSIVHHLDPDMEIVLREGAVRGATFFTRFFEAQYEQFDAFEVEIEDAFEAGDDTLVVCMAVDRRNEPSEGFRMWPAQVLRFDGERLASAEGFPRQDDALAALGIEREAVHHRQVRSQGTAIDAKALARTFPGGIKAVDGIDLCVDAGEIYAFLGPNGAGKTTTVRMLVTLLRPTGGTATVAGHDVVGEPHAVRRAIGVALQEAALDPLMTGLELIELQATLHAIPRADGRRRGLQLLERVGLSEAAGRRVGTYSGGMRRRLDLAMALVHDPKVLFLDEPTTGLDPQSRRAIWDEVRRLNDDGTTVFLTTQYLEEADQLADRVGIINRGRMAAEGTPQALKSRMGRSYVELSVSENGAGAVQSVLQRFGEVLPGDNGAVRVALDTGAADIPPIVRALDEAGMTIASLRLVEPTLDDVFVATTGERLEGEGADEEEG
ncbi:MAG: ATP-binding cassette domain-containing protein [Thermoleophilaceae bacterium]